MSKEGRTLAVSITQSNYKHKFAQQRAQHCSAHSTPPPQERDRLPGPCLASTPQHHSTPNRPQIWNSGYPKEPEKGTCTISKARSAIQNDDADQQTPGSSSRDMGSQGCVLIKDCPNAAAHRSFEVMLFESPPGADSNDDDYPIRLVLVSVQAAARLPLADALCSFVGNPVSRPLAYLPSPLVLLLLVQQQLWCARRQERLQALHCHL